jgi:hypothetical protein
MSIKIKYNYKFAWLPKRVGGQLVWLKHYFTRFLKPHEEVLFFKQNPSLRKKYGKSRKGKRKIKYIRHSMVHKNGKTYGGYSFVKHESK